MSELLTNQYLLGDCLEVMAAIPAGTIDTCITSPPYNKGNRKERPSAIGGKIIYDEHDDKIDEGVYQSNQLEVINEIYRIVKPGGSLFYNHQTRFVKGTAIYPYEWLSKSKWQVRQQLIWNRSNTPQVDPFRFYQTHEDVWWLWKPNGKNPGDNRIPINAAQYTSVWNIQPYQKQEFEREHPCIFPEELPGRCILATTKEGDIILDPYAGAGTTLIAAKKLKRNYIGIDISKGYKKLFNDRQGQNELPL